MDKFKNSKTSNYDLSDLEISIGLDDEYDDETDDETDDEYDDEYDVEYDEEEDERDVGIPNNIHTVNAIQNLLGM